MEAPGIENLRNCQRQLDADGCEVAVSRQAVDETLDALDTLKAALSDAPCPSSMGTAQEHYQRFYDWLNGPAKAALAKAEGRS